MGNAPSAAPHVGWFSRGYLPHWDHPGMIQSVTFRLHDSLASEVVEKWKLEFGFTLGAPSSPTARIKHKHAGKDAGAPRGHGPFCLWDRPESGSVTVNTLSKESP